MNDPNIVLETERDTLRFDAQTHRLVSLRARAAPEQEFIASAREHPTFQLQYLDAEREYQMLTSHAADSVTLSEVAEGDATVLVAEFRGLGGFDLDVTTRVRASTSDALSRWSITVRNGAGIEIVDVQYPFVVCAYSLGGKAGSEALLLPHHFGMLIPSPAMSVLGPDYPAAWQLNRENGSFNHYPGGQFAQFLAYYNDRAGIYFACEDAEGNVKRFRALHRDPGMRIGVAHVGDWPTQGERQLEYDTVIGSFAGDWYAAAEIYRDWSLSQSWAVPLRERKDIPQWLLDSPPYITVRPQGEIDPGPVFPVEEFQPYEKCIPLLERIAERVDSPVVAVLMGWERGASWVYPDCFPPVGGDESLSRFASQARAKGWHLGSFCNGTRWVVGHNWNSYDGRAYYKEHGGDESVCRLPDETPWSEVWDYAWRPSYACCAGAEKTREIASDFVKRLIGWGMESIQFFDQNCGAATFPCFAADHGHPPVPGKWMAKEMAEMVASFRSAAEDAGEPDVINSVEMCCSEFNLPLFQESDSRLCPPGHRAWSNVVPVYQFLFHECIVIQGGMGFAPEPYHLQIRNAYNGVMGQIPGGVLTGDGTLLAKDSDNWAPWEPKVGSDDEALEMIRVVTAMRRGAGRDLLVFGRMMSPAAVEDVPRVEWEHAGARHDIPAIFHAAWRSPDGRFAVALANWTDSEKTVSVADNRLGSSPTQTTEAKQTSTAPARCESGRVSVSVPPLSMVLLTEGK